MLRDLKYDSQAKVWGIKVILIDRFNDKAFCKVKAVDTVDTRKY